MDGRSDFYGDELVVTYQNTMSARYDWRANLERFGIDAVLVKPDTPLATVLKCSPEWALIWDDGGANIFRRRRGVLSQSKVDAKGSAQQPVNSTAASLIAAAGGKSVFV